MTVKDAVSLRDEVMVECGQRVAKRWGVFDSGDEKRLAYKAATDAEYKRGRAIEARARAVRERLYKALSDAEMFVEKEHRQIDDHGGLEASGLRKVAALIPTFRAEADRARWSATSMNLVAAHDKPPSRMTFLRDHLRPYLVSAGVRHPSELDASELAVLSLLGGFWPYANRPPVGTSAKKVIQDEADEIRKALLSLPAF